MVCGEVTHRTNYDKEDLHKERPQVGDLSFSVKEVFPLTEALPAVSEGIRIKMEYADPEIREKVNRIRDAISKSPGDLPVVIELRYPSGKVLYVDLGPGFHVAVSLGFLSELDKVVPQSATTFRPDTKMSLAPREPKPWER